MMLVHRLFMGLVLVSALPFGSDRPWAYAFFAMGFAVLGLVISVQLVRSSPRSVYRALRMPFLLGLVSYIWILVQINPHVPLAWVQPFFSLTQSVFNELVGGTISLSPSASLTHSMKLLTYAVVFFISVYFHHSSTLAKQSLKSVFYGGGVYALYGLVLFFDQSKTILWVEFDKGFDVVHSSFVNRNNYATFAGLTLLSGLPLLFDVMRGAFKYGLKSHYGRQYCLETLINRGWRHLLCFVVIATALLLTESRGGFLSTCLALLVFIGLLQFSHKIQGNSKVFLLVAVVVVSGVLVFQESGDRVVERLDTISLEHNERLIVYDLISQANVNNHLGFGYGSFEKSFRLYRDESVLGYYDLAHNTYLEILFELGFWPATGLFGCLGWLTAICVRGIWRRNRDWVYPTLGACASVLVGAHALVDFSLQIPAVAYLYALLLGMGVAQSFSTRSTS